VVSFTAWQVNPRGKNPRYPLDRGLGGPQSQSRRRGEEKNLDSTGTRTAASRSSSPILYTYGRQIINCYVRMVCLHEEYLQENWTTNATDGTSAI
jgi:hypothetical protein